MYYTKYKKMLEGMKDAESILQGIGGFLNKNSAVIIEGFWKFIVLVARIFAGVLIIEALAGMNPELRELLPSLYRITDLVLPLIEKVCAEDLRFLGI